jgi:hypothetical protein
MKLKPEDFLKKKPQAPYVFVRVDPELKEKLTKVAKKNKLTTNKLILAACEYYLKALG